MPAISSSAPGKIILCGEHAVVYGKPAIAIPVFNVKTKCTIIARPAAPTDETMVNAPKIGLKCNLGCLAETHPIRVTINAVLDQLNSDHLPVCEILIQSSLPTAAGLGSSASTSVALIRALSAFLGHPFENKVVNQIAYEIEKIHHGSPSGIDNTVVTFEQVLFFTKNEPYEFLDLQTPLTFIIADTGVKSSTARAVEGVKQRSIIDPQKYGTLCSKIGEISSTIKELLQSDQLELIGKQLTMNHTLLQEMGVSCVKLDDLVSCALQNGALGAKLSGSGQGGNMIALVEPEKSDLIANALQSAGAVNTIITQIPAKGLS